MCAKKSSAKHRPAVKEQQESYHQARSEAKAASMDPNEYPLIEERYEIIDGVRYELKPSPGLDHQLLVTKLSSYLHDSCHRHGMVVVAPMDVHLSEDNIVQPDVIFIANANMDIIQGQKIEGSPDLVIEILSPHSGKHDKVRKKAVYERFGVPEFWIVDPVHEMVDQFVLDEGKYRLHGTFSDEHALSSARLTCIGIDLKALFREKMQYRESRK